MPGADIRTTQQRGTNDAQLEMKQQAQRKADTYHYNFTEGELPPIGTFNTDTEIVETALTQTSALANQSSPERNTIQATKTAAGITMLQPGDYIQISTTHQHIIHAYQYHKGQPNTIQLDPITKT